jgi:starvation-inducible DNA-binding protein
MEGDPPFVRGDFAASIFKSSWPNDESEATAMTKISTTPPCEAENKDTSVRESTRQDLQAVLGHLFDLRVQGLEAHAHFVGTRFTGFQRQLEAIVDTAREGSDAVADVLRDFDRDSTRRLIITEIPPGISGLRPGQRCTRAAVNMITDRISTVTNVIRCVCNQLGDADASIGALLRAIADTVDKQALMLASESQKINSKRLE